MAYAADEIHRFAIPELEPPQRGQIRAKNYPKRADRTDGQRQRHPPCGHLPQQEPPKPRCNHRRQRKHRRRTDGTRGLQPFKHQHEIDREKPPKHQIAPRRARGPFRHTRRRSDRHGNHHARDHEPRRIQRRGRDQIGRQRAKRK